MKDGRLVQCASPEALLSAPKDAFVADFVGADRALKRLTLTTAGEAATPTPAGPGAAVVSPATSLRDVLSLLLACGADAATVVDVAGTPSGTVSLATIRGRAAARTS
jgi:osmoprotectant transport system ATP-binding protein